MTTLAGHARYPGSADGTGAAASFSDPDGLVLDAFGNLYVTDMSNCNIRKITPAGVVTTLAGQAGACSHADGTGTAARFNDPLGIGIDKSGNLYVADGQNYTIRKITSFGIVTTLAGQAGKQGSADGTGTAAAFSTPFGIAVDASGNLYVADYGNHTIRKITPAGVVTTLAGQAGNPGNADGRGAVARFFYPAGLAIAPDGTMYVADEFNSTIRKIGPGYPIGGTVSGLGGAMILQDNGADNLAVNANGSFIFDMPVAVSGVYNATVLTQPAGQTCSVANGSGTATADVTNIAVSCSGSPATAYTLGGTVSGLAANTSLVLQNSNGENLNIAANGTFSFKATVNSYSVTVRAQPVGQTCTVTSGSGTATANVGNIGVSCSANNFSIGGTASGLTGTLVLQDNGGDNLSLSANGSFAFATQLAFNSTYNVTVLTQPTGQTCTVSNSVGGTAMGSVNGPVNLSVQCTANTYSIGGTLSGLAGTLVLQNNAGDDLSLSANGSFAFATPLPYNSAYNVTVLTQPAGQTCTVTSGNGTATANVTNVAVSCVDNAATYVIGGMVNGLNATSVVLQDNNGDDLTAYPGAPGLGAPFTFATPISSGGAYNVTVSTQPTDGQTCTVTSGGSGTATSDVSSVAITCI